jgi:hypothetical protein
MFLAGIKFALGLMTGEAIFTGALALLLECMDSAESWRQKAASSARGAMRDGAASHAAT